MTKVFLTYLRDFASFDCLVKAVVCRAFTQTRSERNRFQIQRVGAAYHVSVLAPSKELREQKG